jgi:hypothetical protein
VFTQRVNIAVVLCLQWFMRSRRNHRRAMVQQHQKGERMNE